MRLLLSLLLGAVLCATTRYGDDYGWDAAPGIDAALDGDLSRFISAQPLMGVFSLLVRLPAVGLARLAGGGELVQYQAGCFACVAISAVIMVWVSERARLRGAPAWLVLALPLIAVFNPMTTATMAYGHPEELLAGALLVAAVVSMSDGRLLWGGLLLGLAVATKQWALIAVPVVIISALPGRRLAVLAAAGGIALLMTAPFAIGDPESFRQNLRAMSDSRHELFPNSVWLPLAHHSDHAVVEVIGAQNVYGETWVAPRWVSKHSHAAIVLAGIPIALLVWWRRRGRALSPEDALTVLALVLLVRCVLDPWNNGYYHVPMLLALFSAEALTSDRRVPWLSAWAIGGLAAISYDATTLMPFDDGFVGTNVFYLAWSLPLLAALTRRVLAVRAPSPAAPRVPAEPRREPAIAPAG